MLQEIQWFFSFRKWKDLVLRAGVIHALLLVHTVSQAQVQSFEFEGRTRTYDVFLPQDFQPDMPVILNLHGYLVDYIWQRDKTLFHEVADTAGYITVYPNSIPRSFNTGLIDYPNPPIDTTVNDVGFISALIDTLKAHYDIDLNRIYSCGYSQGGTMTYKLAGQLGHRFAAVANVAGPLIEDAPDELKPPRPFPVLHMHGTSDPIAVWEGGNDNTWGVEQTLDFWIENNNCSMVSDTVTLPDIDTTDGCTVQKISYTDCSGEGMVIFYKIIGGAHTWPGAPFFQKFGNTNMDINTNIEIVNFFKQFTNPIADMAFIQTIEVPPICHEFTGDSIVIGAGLYNPSNHLAEVFAYIKGKNSEIPDTLQLYDDGQHGDGAPNDNMWGARWLPPVIDEMYEINLTSEDQTYGIIQDYFWKNTFSILSVVPEVTVRVEDLHTGEPLHGSEVFFGSTKYLTNEEGEIQFQECGGEYSFVVDFDDYGGVVKKFDVRSDTTIIITLVRNSYIKVMDRLTGDPVIGARVFYGDGVDVTDDEGLAAIRDYRKEQFIYRVEYATFFTLEDSIALVPGDTLSTQLTRQVANIDFYVTDETGPVSNQAVIMSGLSKKTEPDGLAGFLSMPARRVYHYSVERDCYLPVFDSLFLEIDTTVHIMLEPDMDAPELQVDMIGDSLLQVISSKSGIIYAVPPGTPKHPDSIQAAQILSVPVLAGQLLEIPTAGLPEGDYSIYVIDGCLNISTPFVTDVEDHVASNIRIYPNPAHDLITIRTKKASAGSIEISTINGQLMYRNEINELSHQIDLSAFSRGIYLITIHTKSRVITRKILKL